MVWFHLGGFTASSTSGGQDVAYAVAIVVRVAAELWLAAVVVRDVLDPARDPVRAWDRGGPGGQDSRTRSNDVVV